MEIPYVNLKMQHAPIIEELISSIKNVLIRGDYVLGQEVELFEKLFGFKIGVDYSVSVNSGTDALLLTLKALNIGHGDEVITVPNSFLATTSSIILSGSLPVFVDVDNDQNINPYLIEKAITKRCKAILPVHLTGRPARMDIICEIAEKYGLYVIEDCAQAIGAKYNKQHIGAFGIAGCFSLHPLKNLNGCGDGGIIVTNDEYLFNRLKRLRNHGLLNRDECEEWGYNSRLDTIQAAILKIKLKYIDEWNEKRRRNAKKYIKKLCDTSLHLPVEKKNEHCVYHAFVIQTEKRNELKSYLNESGIDTKIHYPIPIHFQKAANHLGYKRGDFPVAEKHADTILSLPIYPELKEKHLDRIIHCVKSFFK